MKKSIGAIVNLSQPEVWTELHRLRNGQPRNEHPRKPTPSRPAPWSGYARVGADYRQRLIDRGFLRPAQKPTNA